MKHAVLLYLLFAVAGPAEAQYSVEALNEAPPAELSEAIRAELNPSGLRVKSGANVLIDLWFRKTLPSEPAKGIARSYPQLPDVALIAGVRVPGRMTDNRNNAFPKGVYTMRHGLQPQDGNHAGSSEYIDFALLINAKNDTTVAGAFATSLDMIRRSLTDSGVGHPIVFAMLPPTAGSHPSMHHGDHDRWTLEVKVGETPVSIVLVGTYEH